MLVANRGLNRRLSIRHSGLPCPSASLQTALYCRHRKDFCPGIKLFKSHRTLPGSKPPAFYVYASREFEQGKPPYLVVGPVFSGPPNVAGVQLVHTAPAQPIGVSSQIIRRKGSTGPFHAWRIPAYRRRCHTHEINNNPAAYSSFLLVSFHGRIAKQVCPIPAVRSQKKKLFGCCYIHLTFYCLCRPAGNICRPRRKPNSGGYGDADINDGRNG